MCRPLRSFDVSNLTGVSDVLRAIDEELADLANIARDTDFENPAHRAQFSRNVTFLKTYYERAETLIREQLESTAGGALA